MVDALDLLQCPTCGTWYKPEDSPTTTVKWLTGEVHVDWDAALSVEGARLTGDVVDPPLTGPFLDVVDPPLTGSLLDIEV